MREAVQEVNLKISVPNSLTLTCSGCLDHHEFRLYTGSAQPKAPLTLNYIIIGPLRIVRGLHTYFYYIVVFIILSIRSNDVDQTRGKLVSLLRLINLRKLRVFVCLILSFSVNAIFLRVLPICLLNYLLLLLYFIFGKYSTDENRVFINLFY